MTQDIGPEGTVAESGAPAEEDRRKRRGAIWPWIAFVILLLILLWLLWHYFGRGPSGITVRSGREIPLTSTSANPGGVPTSPSGGVNAPNGPFVPDVLGMSKPSAVSALSAAGYPASVTTVYGGTSAAGIVIKQNPSGGSTLTRGRTVGIMVRRSSRPTALVTNYLSMSQAAATRKAKSAGFKVVLSYSPYTGRQKDGSVFSQWPLAGKRQVVGGDLQLQIVIKP